MRAAGRRIFLAHHRRYATAAWLAWRLSAPSVRRRNVVIEYVHNVFDDRRTLSFRAPYQLAVGSGIERMLLTQYGKRPERVRVVSNTAAQPASTVHFVEGAKPLVVGIGRL